MAIETLNQILTVIQLATAVLLILAILLQRQSASLSGAFGGGDSATFHVKRGGEKFLHLATVFLAIVFFGASLSLVLLS